MKVLAWGTYDLSKPRVRILMRALESSGVTLQKCHVDVWDAVADKSQIRGALAKLRLALNWLLAYPKLIWCLLRSPKPDVIFVGYLGQFDVLILWPFAKLRGIPIAWDAFISLYNTVVEDRRMVGPRNPLALLLYAVEWLACRAADRVILDTRAHADYFVERFGVATEKTAAVFVGAEMENFVVKPVQRDPAQPYTVLFYGQFIPLHGIPTIIEAARLLKNEPIDWVVIGKGQEEKRIAQMLDQHPLPRLQWIPWVKYEELVDHIARADVCLGIFDDGCKASRVIPNKVFQIIASGKPLITRDSPAMRELVAHEIPEIAFVEAANPDQLAQAVLAMQTGEPAGTDWHTPLARRFGIESLKRDLIECLPFKTRRV